MDNLQDKIVMITGGAGGLGHDFVKIMLENGAKNVAIVDLPTSQGQAQAIEFEGKYGKGRAVFFPCDVTNAEESKATFKKIVETFGGLDILINCAGIIYETRVELMIEVNLTSVIRISLLAMDHMGKHKGGKGGTIINIASIFGLSTQNCQAPIYCATKYAVVGFSQCLANFHYISNVRVITLCPGFTNTSFITEMFDGRFLDLVDYEVFSSLNFPHQTVDNVSRALLQLIQTAKNGQIWVSEDNQLPYTVNVPKYSELAAPVE